jgi:hypothetical protein
MQRVYQQQHNKKLTAAATTQRNGPAPRTKKMQGFLVAKSGLDAAVSM